MSGIFGIVASKQQINLEDAAGRMARVMSHRPWFVAEYITDDEQAIALGRIGIGIFNQVPQPVWNKERTVALVMAGEFYNQDSLDKEITTRAKTDEEIALALYERDGEAFVKQLHGTFIIAIWNKCSHQVIVINDRFGLYPHYYSYRNNKLIFTPEMKGILSDPTFSKKLDIVALAEYIRFQYLLGDKTFFEELKLFPNASILIYDIEAECLTLQPYWDISQIPTLPATLTFEEAVDEAGRLLKAAVDRRTTGAHRLGVYLSAGVDSRVILGLMNRALLPVPTITFGQQNCRDAIYAQRIAKIVGTEHHYFEFQDGRWVEEFADFHLELTEGFHSWIHAHGISILSQVRPLLDINLTGFGGGQSPIDWEDISLLKPEDELAFSNRLFEILCQHTTWPSLTEAEARTLFLPSLPQKMYDLAFDSFQVELSRYQYLPYYQRAAYFGLCNPDRRMFQYYTIFHRSHIEQRFPFHDYNYFEFVYGLPPEMLFNRKLRRAIILKMIPSLAGVPYDKDDLPITDNELSRLTAKLTQKGRNFINRYVRPLFPAYTTLYADYETWLRNELRTWGEDIFLGEQTLQRNIFNPEALRSLWHRHQSGLELHTIGKIAPIMTYEMMLRRFYDRS